MAYIASVEIDQRQNFIQQADTLREMVGASRMIEYSIARAREHLPRSPGVYLFWPVSGVLRFYSEQIENLGNFLFEYCESLAEVSLTCSVGVAQCGPDFDEDLMVLDRRVRGRKDAKAGTISLPSTPYFAACKILPQLPANFWNPDGQAGRELRSWQASERHDFQTKFWNKPVFGRTIPYSELPDTVDDFAQDSDSYIAILKGDVDALGTLLTKLRFMLLAQHPQVQPFLKRELKPGAAAAEKFSSALQTTLERAIHEAYEEVHPPEWRLRGTLWPFRHLIVAGDDVLILSSREVALDLAYQIASRFASLAKQDPVLNAALACAGVSEGLTISFGVLFAKSGYPFDASFDLAEDLLKSAKDARKESARSEPNSEAFLDFHWLGDSARPRLDGIRRSQQFYRDDSGKEMWLTTRPWGLTALNHYIKASRILGRLPRRKIKQLEEIASLGYELSELAFQAWLNRLRRDEQDSVDEALTTISWPYSNGRPVLWDVNRGGEEGYKTCFLDLVQLSEILR